MLLSHGIRVLKTNKTICNPYAKLNVVVLPQRRSICHVSFLFVLQIILRWKNFSTQFRKQHQSCLFMEKVYFHFQIAPIPDENKLVNVLRDVVPNVSMLTDDLLGETSFFLMC